MNEILFRAKDISGEWRGGLLAESTGYPGQVEKGVYISNTVGMPWAFRIRPETIGQYINLHDNDGDKIFSGHIVRIHTTKWINAEVKIQFGIPMLCSKEFADGFDYVSEYLQNDGEYGWIDCKIVGNKFDNPDLLK